MRARSLTTFLVCLVLAEGLVLRASAAENLAAGHPPVAPAAVRSPSSRLMDASLHSYSEKPLLREGPSGPRAWSQSLFWVGAAADLYSTRRVLDTPGLSEANPLISLGPDDDAALLSAAAAKTATFFLVRHFVRKGKLRPRQADALLGTFGGAQLLATRHNLELVRDAP